MQFYLNNMNCKVMAGLGKSIFQKQITNNHNAVKILYFASRKIQNFATECLAIVDCGSISGNTFQSTTYMLWPKFSSSLFAEQNFFFRSKNMYSTVQFCEIRVLFIFLAKIASIPVGKKARKSWLEKQYITIYTQQTSTTYKILAVKLTLILYKIKVVSIVSNDYRLDVILKMDFLVELSTICLYTIDAAPKIELKRKYFHDILEQN